MTGSEARPRETLKSRGNKTQCFPHGQTLSVLLYLPTQKENKNAKKSFAWRRLTDKLAAFLMVHDLITCESKVQVVVSLGSY